MVDIQHGSACAPADPAAVSGYVVTARSERRRHSQVICAEAASPGLFSALESGCSRSIDPCQEEETHGGKLEARKISSRRPTEKPLQVGGGQTN